MQTSRSSVVSLGALLGLVATIASAQVVTPLGPEFHLSFTDISQPVGLAADRNGRFLALLQDVFSVTLRAWGWRDGSTLPSFSPAGDENWGSVAAVGPDTFAVAWPRVDLEAFQQDVLFALYSADGAPIRSEQLVTPESFPWPSDPRLDIARTPDGVVIVWTSDWEEIEARFVPFSTPAPPPSTVTFSSGVSAREPRVAATQDGRTLVVWFSSDCAPEYPDGCVRARHFDPAGNPTGPEFVLSTSPAGAQEYPAAAASGDGFVVVWQSEACTCIRARRLDGNGVPEGAEILVDEPDGPPGRVPAISATQEGDFLVTWSRGSQPSVPYLRAFDPLGRPLTDGLPISDPPELYSWSTQVALSASGEFVVVWERDDEEMLARRFRLQVPVFADGFESGDTSAWSRTTD
ncbi:MAG: hypothetical protein R2991_02660 [Thermoanaerobaculia bacterium]